MSTTAEERVFSIRHQAWSRLALVVSDDGVNFRRLRGGASEAWHLDLDPGARLSSRGIAAEGVLTVQIGRLLCTIFGNEVELPTGHFALIPPNTPFSIRVGGRSQAQAVAFFNRVLPDAPPIELG
jgi:hypothetical protein